MSEREARTPGDEPVVEVDAELEPLIPRFMERRRDEVGVLRRAVEERDVDTLRSIGHALKGTAGGYGFHLLTELGGDLEAAADAGDLDRAGDIVRGIAAHVERVRIDYV